MFFHRLSEAIVLVLFVRNDALVLVQLWSEEIPMATKVAVQACAGLFNRNASLPSVYVNFQQKCHSFSSSPDEEWIDALEIFPSDSYDADMFLRYCLEFHPRQISYDYASQQAVLPNIITMGAVLDAIPLDDKYPVAGSVDVAFDAVRIFSHNSALEATKYVYEKYVQSTTAMVKLNPGYNERIPYPTITREIIPSLIDFVVKEKLFAFFLPHGCVPLTAERDLVQRMATSNPWPRPIPVYGFDTSLQVEGADVYEAETMCIPARNMGAIVSETATNLSFFSRRKAIGVELKVVQNDPMHPTYDASKIYIAFIIGDGDNIGYLKGPRADWMRLRRQACHQDMALCPPLTWTISPHLKHLAPEILSWYVNMSHSTKRDFFLLPPSGHLYSYPASTPPEVQRQIVAATERDAEMLNTSGLVDWEWFTTWKNAEEKYYPRYCVDGRIRGIFPLSVPYFSPTFRFSLDEYFKVLHPSKCKNGNALVTFRPKEWRSKNPSDMAQEVGSYPLGSIAYVYMTSDGGLQLEHFLEMSKALPPHVELVSTEAATTLALNVERMQSRTHDVFLPE